MPFAKRLEEFNFNFFPATQDFLYFSLSLAKPQLPFVTVATFGDTLINNLVLFFWLSNKIPTSFMGEEDPKKPEPAGPSTAAKTIEEHDDPVKEDKESVPNGNAQRTFLNPFAQPPRISFYHLCFVLFLSVYIYDYEQLIN